MGKKKRLKQGNPNPAPKAATLTYARGIPLQADGPWYRYPTLMALLGAILAITFIAYTPTFQNELTNWDDDLYVTKNEHIRDLSGKGIQGMFALEWGKALKASVDKETAAQLDRNKNTFVAGNYHPLTLLSLAVNYAISGDEPWSYQLFNILLHLLNTFLVFVLVYRLSRGKAWIALFTSAVFALHPMHVESVTWVAERKDVLYTAFFLGGMLTYLSYIDHGKRMGWLVATMVLFVLSCLAKPAAVVFPLVMGAMDYFRKRPLLDVRVLAEKAVFFIPSVIFGLLTLTAQIDADAYGGLQRFTIFERLLLASYGFVMYIVRFFVPYNMSAFYPYPPEIPMAFTGFLVVAISIAGFTLWTLGRTRYVAFGMLFYLFTVMLVLQFVSVGDAIVADRYTYVPYIGLAFAVGYGIHRLIQQPGYRNWLPYGLAGALLLFSGLTFARTMVWKDSITLFTNTVKNYPTAKIAYNNRGHAYRQKTDHAQNEDEKVHWLMLAKADYEAAMSIDPRYHLAYSNRGKVWFELKDYRMANSDYTLAIQFKPDNASHYVNRAATFGYLGRLDSALVDLNKAEELNPNNLQLYYNRGAMHLQLNNFEAALADNEKYLQLNPGNHDVVNAKGVALQRLSRNDEAIQVFTQALQLSMSGNNQNLGIYYLNRSFSYFQMGNIEAARQDVRSAQQQGNQQINPEYLRSLGL